MLREGYWAPIIGFAQPWSRVCHPNVARQGAMAVIAGPEDLEKFRGKLKGKIVLTAAVHASTLSEEPLSRRLTDAELEAAATSPEPTSGNPAGLPLGFTRPGTPGRGAAAPAAGGRGAAGGGRGNFAFRAQLNKFLKEEGVLLVLTPGN